MAKFDEKYAETTKKVDCTKACLVAKAVRLAKETNAAKFDASVEVSFKLNMDPRHADQQTRGAMVLPHGTDRTQKVYIITQRSKEWEAKDVGADLIGGKELPEDVRKEWFNFGIVVATPNVMDELGKLECLLGPKGLMPNPKTGTVTMDVAKAVEDTKKGKVEHHINRERSISLMIGKVSLGDEKLVDNFDALLKIIPKVRPAVVKGTYIRNLVISTTMGPGVEITVGR